MRSIQLLFLFALLLTMTSLNWGFFAHQKINRLAVFTLPPEMMGFYKRNIEYIAETSVNPDKRRYAVAGEAPRHYIDLDEFGDSAAWKLPRYWNDAVKTYGEDSLTARGIVPWHIAKVFYQLKDAFLLKDPDLILKISAELGHYVADAHVPLHTTSNYDGQLTGQQGIHAFWESRLPELFFEDYDFLVGRASYLENVQVTAWAAVMGSHLAADSVLTLEKLLSRQEGGRRYNFESKGKQTVKVYSQYYAKKYHEKLNGMVERQMRGSVKMIGDLWFTAWVDAGQPDLKVLINYQPTEAELAQRKEEIKKWKEQLFKSREHEGKN